MKNYLSFLIVLLLLFSCQSSNKIIKKYLKDEISNDTLKNNVIIKQQITFSETLRTFQGMKLSFNSDELKTYNDLKSKYKNDKEEIWTYKKFNLSNIKIIDEDSINNYIQSRRNKLQNKYFADKFNIYFISKPYFYNNNKNIIFRINKTRVFNNRIFDEVVVMERKKGKWIVLEKKVNSDL